LKQKYTKNHGLFTGAMAFAQRPQSFDDFTKKMKPTPVTNERKYPKAERYQTDLANTIRRYSWI
jgi:hypothetical protein